MAIRSSGVCPKCSREVQDGWRVCPSCAAPLPAGNGERETKTVFLEAPPSSSGIEEGRFPAGTILAGRYRVLGLLGKGGMGEVYRAHDQILNQAVALKFLAHARMDEAALARFRNNEVRIARQVSHPNVCRVYDIGSIEGQHFLSMEYLDGEDLNSLIRRIGRLPWVDLCTRLLSGSPHTSPLRPAGPGDDGGGSLLVATADARDVRVLVRRPRIGGDRDYGRGGRVGALGYRLGTAAARHGVGGILMFPGGVTHQAFRMQPPFDCSVDAYTTDRRLHRELARQLENIDLKNRRNCQCRPGQRSQSDGAKLMILVSRSTHRITGSALG